MEDGSTFEHKGTLEFSEVSVDPATGSFGLRVKVDNPDGLLMPGMYVRAVIGGGVRSDAVLVPMRGCPMNWPRPSTAVAFPLAAACPRCGRWRCSAGSA
ncbi:hypothetical protein G6F59_015707 [Rhizopus arrhizus]|nr:hypothetical protein G6F59_015707 [Rhizopus arrhizus]